MRFGGGNYEGTGIECTRGSWERWRAEIKDSGKYLNGRIEV